MKRWSVPGLTTQTAKQEPICESDVQRIFDVPMSNLYRSEVTAPDGTVKVFDGVRAYVSSMVIGNDGRITMQLEAKAGNIRTPRISYPYNYIVGDVLCVMKLNRMRMKSNEESRTFALAYDLFCLPWRTCLVMHKPDGASGPVLAFTGRKEWDEGELNAYNQEVQMFLRVSDEGMVPAELLRGTLNERISSWAMDCETEMARKKV